MAYLQNLATRESVIQLSVDISGNIGLGLILQGGIKVPFYQIQE